MSRVVAAALGWCLASVSVVGVSVADDWPQWMGPQRDNVWRESGVIDKFPADGPPVMWRTEIASGYAGPSVANGRVYVTDYVTGDNVKVGNFERKEFTGTERVLCLDAGTGELIWKHEYPVKYAISYPSGPRCTPLVHEGKVYTLGAEGNLICFDAASGAIRWQKNLPEEYQTKTALWGYASQPLIDGEKLICLVGGEGSHCVAFQKDTGKELWRTLSAPEQGYSPPVIFEVAGRRQLILFKPDAVAAVDPADGEPLWSVPYEATNGSVIMTPIRHGNLLYVAGYSNKNMLIELDTNKPGASIRWQNLSKQAMAPINVQPFRIDNVIYGYDQNGAMYAVEIETGKRIWQSNEALRSRRPPGSGTAFIVRQDDRFWLFTEKGELIIAQLSPEGYEEIDSVKLLEPSNVAFGRDVVWAAPAFANRSVFLRNDNEIIRVNLSAR